jgi:hypothetical protein
VCPLRRSILQITTYTSYKIDTFIYLRLLRDSERILILRTLEAVGWVIGGPKGAAAKLGLKRTTLIHRMEKLEISRPGLQRVADAMGPTQQETDSPPYCSNAD